MNSIWQLENNLIFPQLNQDINVDVLIIGAGLSGVMTAFYLKDSKKKIALIEQDKIGSGTTGYTSGKITTMQGLIYHKLEKMHGFEISKKYYESQKYAIDLIKKNIEKYDIDCDLKENTGYVFTNLEKNLKLFKEEEKFYEKAHIKYMTHHKIPIRFPVLYSIKTYDNYVFHPLKYLNKIVDIIKDNIKIYEHTKAMEIIENDGYEIITQNNTIRAKKVIICTNYPFFIKPFFFPIKTTVEKSYFLASKTEHPYLFNAISYEQPTVSIRYHEDYILYGGLSHLISKNIDHTKNMNKLITNFSNYFNKKEDLTWSTHDVMTNDSLPFIGEIKNNLYIATGYNKWGMTNSNLAGKIIADLVLNRTNPYSELFEPKRKLKFKNYIVDNINNLGIFVKSKLIKNYPFYFGSLNIKNNIGSFYKNGTVHRVSTVCPHLKCSLIFNSTDETWDCPCHGSRFDIDGNVIKGPANYSIKIDK